MQSAAPVTRDLVLVGGGHAHVEVLRRFAMAPEPGVRITLVSNASSAPYSGMIPGCIAGHYTRDEAHIELRPLCRLAGARFCPDAVIGIDLAQRRILCASRPPVGFDLVSFNVGSTPRWREIPGAAEHAIPIKPIAGFLEQLDRLPEERFRRAAGPCRIVVVGGGAGGVELLLALRERWRPSNLPRDCSGAQLEFHLVTAAAALLPSHNRGVRRRYERILRERSVAVHTGCRVHRVSPTALHGPSDRTIPFDLLFWATDASAPDWIRQSGLNTDTDGFLAVNEFLQSNSHPFVFGAGDVVAMVDHPRPKAGVFAVRQGRPLADNLRHALRGEQLRRFVPQRHFLSLISTGDAYAVASRGPFHWEGRWVWRWKDWIDRRWMRTYQAFPPTTAPHTPGSGSAALEAMPSSRPSPRDTLRCGGCGSKVGSDILRRALGRLQHFHRDDVLVGLQAPDDAAVVRIPPGMLAVQTVDYFRDFLDDPFLFGRIAANHCLGDIFAMGAEPQSALAIATLPFGLPDKVEEQLHQLLAGALRCLSEHRTELVGGHTGEGAELAFGLAVTGFASPERLLRKGGMRPGDRLLLTKPLGTGILLAAEMRGRARGRWVEGAIASMVQSNAAAAGILLDHGATACTDVTGFGLLGHLLEMATASDTRVVTRLDSLPSLEGAPEMARLGILSSLDPANRALLRSAEVHDDAERADMFPLLFDPQTAGGLLASVPREMAADCLARLRSRGIAATDIGEVTGCSDSDARRIEIRRC